MSKFKVGDKVRLKAEHRPYWKMTDATWGIVLEVEDESYVLIAYRVSWSDPEGASLLGWREDALELVEDSAVDNINHPSHYVFSNGAEVIDISENLTSNAAQAVQYLSRSSRIDGNNKGDVLEDLSKAEWFVKREIARVKEAN